MNSVFTLSAICQPDAYYCRFTYARLDGMAKEGQTLLFEVAELGSSRKLTEAEHYHDAGFSTESMTVWFVEFRRVVIAGFHARPAAHPARTRRPAQTTW